MTPDMNTQDAKAANPNLADQEARDLCEFYYHYRRANPLKRFMVNALVTWFFFTGALRNASWASWARAGEAFQVMLWPQLAPVLLGLLASVAITWALAGRSLVLLVAGLALGLAAILQARRVYNQPGVG